MTRIKVMVESAADIKSLIVFFPANCGLNVKGFVNFIINIQESNKKIHIRLNSVNNAVDRNYLTTSCYLLIWTFRS